MSTDYRILIYAPDMAVREPLIAGLGTSVSEFVWCDDFPRVIALLDRAEVDAVLLCLSATGAGLDLLDWITQKACAIPVLLASAADALDMRIVGLERGAADYLLMPFGKDELRVRVATAVRRRASLLGRFIRRRGLVFDTEVGRLGDGVKWTILTPTEHQAFSLLFEHEARPVSKTRLKNALAAGKCITDNAIEVIIYRLRAKAQAWGMRIRTYRGSGYVLEYA